MRNWRRAAEGRAEQLRGASVSCLPTRCLLTRHLCRGAGAAQVKLYLTAGGETAPGLSPVLRACIQRGRPDVQSLLAGLVTTHRAATTVSSQPLLAVDTVASSNVLPDALTRAAVFVCGPKPLEGSVAEACSLSRSDVAVHLTRMNFEL